VEFRRSMSLIGGSVNSSCPTVRGRQRQTYLPALLNRHSVKVEEKVTEEKVAARWGLGPQAPAAVLERWERVDRRPRTSSSRISLAPEEELASRMRRGAAEEAILAEAEAAAEVAVIEMTMKAVATRDKAARAVAWALEACPAVGMLHRLRPWIAIAAALVVAGAL